MVTTLPLLAISFSIMENSFLLSRTDRSPQESWQVSSSNRRSPKARVLSTASVFRRVMARIQASSSLLSKGLVR